MSYASQTLGNLSIGMLAPYTSDFKAVPCASASAIADPSNSKFSRKYKSRIRMYVKESERKQELKDL